MDTWSHERARVASLSRSRSATDPELVTARQRLRTARLDQHIAKLVAEAPPLTQSQRDRLSVLLRPPGDEAA